MRIFHVVLGMCTGTVGTINFSSCSLRGGRILPCGGGVEYLHHNPASRRRRRKGNSRIWDSKIWSKVPREPDLKMTALARTRRNCIRQTRPLVRESSRINKPATVWLIKIWSQAPDGCFIPRQTGRLTVGRNTRLILLLSSLSVKQKVDQ
jgi:hypothetical protein